MSPARIEFAHMLRGIAAASVLLSHLAYLFWRKPEAIADLIAYPATAVIAREVYAVALPDFGLPNLWAHFGVALFFLISGFVIPFSLSTFSRAGFAVARAFRIWPTYLLGLGVAVACIALNARLSNTAFPYSPLEISMSALIVPRWPTWTRSIDGIVWTLEVELFFYASCTLLMNHIRRFDRWIFALALPAVALACFVGWQSETLLGFSLAVFRIAHWASAMPTYASYMLCGTAFYYHYHCRLNRVELAAAHGLLLGAFVVAMRLGVLSAQGWSAPAGYVLAYGLFALAYLGRHRLTNPPAWCRWPLHRLADISYPLYAVHGVLGYTILAHMLEAGAAVWVAFAVTLAIVLGVAVVVHKLVEVPSQSYGKKLALNIGALRPAERAEAGYRGATGSSRDDNDR